MGTAWRRTCRGSYPVKATRRFPFPEPGGELPIIEEVRCLGAPLDFGPVVTTYAVL